jgi:glycolate oxidase FAD binding subunit
MQSPFSYTPSSSVMPSSVEEIVALITEPANAACPLLFHGSGTKWDAGHRRFAENVANPLIISTAKLTGIVEYDSGELTITVRAGTSMAEVEAALAQHGQYLPFDPLFSAAGATIGGTIAAGLTGPRRMRYGGLRDFVIGIDYLNADGHVIRSGGKVVKNAAGYDFSKLFCGSMGSLGLITQASFKVFPTPQGSRTLIAALPDIGAVKTAFRALQHSPAEVSAVDVWARGTMPMMIDPMARYTIAVLIEGSSASLDGRMNAVRNLLNSTAVHLMDDPKMQARLWSSMRDLAWIGDAETVLKLYLPSTRVSDLDAILAQHDARRVYSVAGNVAWAALSGDPVRLSSALAANEISATVWRSPVATADVIGGVESAAMIERVKRAFDPTKRLYGGDQHA